MKKILLMIFAPFVFFSAFSVPTTQEKADEIVSERMNQETQSYAKNILGDYSTDTALRNGDPQEDEDNEDNEKEGEDEEEDNDEEDDDDEEDK